MEAWRCVPYTDQFLGVRIGQRLQQHAFENAEYHGISADTGR